MISVFFLFFIYSLPSAHSAQLAFVVGEQVEVYEKPDSTSRVLEKVLNEEPVVISNIPLNGYFKVRTIEKKNIGWILVEKLNIKNSESYFQLVSLGGVNVFNPKKVFSQFSNFLLNYSVGGEISWFFRKTLGITLHGEYLFGSAVVQGNLVQLTTLPVMGGFKWSFLEGKNFFVSWNILGGLSLTSAVSLVNQVQFSAYPLLVSTRIDFNYRISQKLFILLQGGYLYQVPHFFSANGLSKEVQLMLNPQFSLDFSGFFSGVGVGLFF